MLTLCSQNKVRARLPRSRVKCLLTSRQGIVSVNGAHGIKSQSFTRSAGTINVSNNYSSLQDAVYALGKAGMRPNRLSKFSPSLPWKQFQCGSDGRRPCRVLSKTTVEHSSFYIPLSSTVCYLLVLHTSLLNSLLLPRSTYLSPQLSVTSSFCASLLNGYFLVLHLSPQRLLPRSTYLSSAVCYFLVLHLSPQRLLPRSAPVSSTVTSCLCASLLHLSLTPVSSTVTSWLCASLLHQSPQQSVTPSFYSYNLSWIT